MGEVIEFPIELTRPPEGIAYDLDTVAVVSEVLYEIMEERDYEINQKLKDDIKVLTNLAYAACRRQAEEEDEKKEEKEGKFFEKNLRGYWLFSAKRRGAARDRVFSYLQTGPK